MLYLTLKRAGGRQAGVKLTRCVFALTNWSYFCADFKHSTGFSRRVYQWNGLATQVGAMSGTAIAFPLVFWCESLFTE